MQLDTILNITTKYNLTGEELLLVYLTFIAQTENGNPEENRIYFKRWYDGGGKERLRDLFNSLKEKGVIKKNYNPSVYDPDEIELLVKMESMLQGKDLLVLAKIMRRYSAWAHRVG